MSLRLSTALIAFLSTLSLRRATRGLLHHTRQAKYFYPRSPCGERHPENLYSLRIMAFLSTLSLRRATLQLYRPVGQTPKFLSTLSLRRATYTSLSGRTDIQISIHALLAESDWIITLRSAKRLGFLSTLSLRRATDYTRKGIGRLDISIHALLAESDCAHA